MNTCIDCGTKIDPRAKARCKPCNYTRGSNRKHGHSPNGKPSPTMRCYMAMRQRCENPNHNRYSYYGGKGVTVCNQWQDFPTFLADMGERPSPEHSLDRIDPEGAYTPDNTRWLPLCENISRAHKN